MYGLLRKKSPLNSVEGLTLETAILSLPALIFLFCVAGGGGESFLNDWPSTFLLMGAGVSSGMPLLSFIIGARMIDLSLIGILQYIYPTLIFLVGTLIYHEPLNEAKLIGFAFIWTALILYTLEGVLRNRQR